MIFANFQRLVSNKIIAASQIIFVRNMSTVFVSRQIIEAAKQHSKISNGNHSCSLLGFVSNRYFSTEAVVSKNIEKQMPILQMKKRPLRKKRLISEDEEASKPGFWNVKALATAEDYNLEALMEGLLAQNLYLPSTINTSSKCEEKIVKELSKNI